MVLTFTKAPKTECGYLRAGKLKTATYVYPPKHRENAASEQAEIFGTRKTIFEKNNVFVLGHMYTN